MAKTLALAALLSIAAADDLITNLPGWNGAQKMYAGYVNVNVSHGRELFYWYVESAGNPATDPLVLWTNGGPGCSSLSGGLFSELGPFFPNSDGSLSLVPNIFTWSQKANVIFIEQPAGVGFSYSDTVSDYVTGDFQASEDVYHFLQGFYVKYPALATRDLYFTGESYAGHYVPSFAKSVVTHNANGDTPVIPLKGFAVGNAWTVAELDNIGAVEYWYTRAMIDNATRNGIYAVCNMSDIGPLLAQRASPRASRVVRAASDAEVAMGVNVPARPLGFTPLRDGAGVPVLHNGDDCDTIVNAAFNNLGGIDIYDSYVDVCPSKAVAPVAADSNNNAAGCATTYDPCRDDKTTTYLNTASVKTAIHANMNITWTGCSSIVDYSRFDLLSSMLPTYEMLIAAGLRIWVYSGDVDAIVPTIGTRSWLAALPLTEAAALHPWSVNGQVGGWTTEYKELTFATVRNAGHFVPELQGERALYMINTFLAGGKL